MIGGNPNVSCTALDHGQNGAQHTAPISCPFESAVEGTAKKCRNNSYVPSIKCTSISSPVSSRKAMLQDRANDLGDHCHVMAHSKSPLQLRASCVLELIHSVL